MNQKNQTGKYKTSVSMATSAQQLFPKNGDVYLYGESENKMQVGVVKQCGM